MGDIMVMEFLRQFMRCSVDDVAAKSEVSPEKLRLFWAGKAGVNDEELRAIAKALNWYEDERYLLTVAIDRDEAVERQRRHATTAMRGFIDDHHMVDDAACGDDE